MKFLIYAPPYTHQSAGVHCLYLLSDILNKNGYIATVTSKARNRSFIYNDDAYSNDSIAIIPDTAYRKDVIKHKYYARWALMYPYFFKVGDPDYEKDPCVFSYLQQLYPPGKEFYLNVFDKNLYNKGNLQRKGSAFYIGKGIKDCNVDGIEITRTKPEKKQDLIKILQSIENFYCFDNYTALSQEAYMCGCNVYIRKDKNWVEDGHSTVDKPSTPINEFIDYIKQIYNI